MIRKKLSAVAVATAVLAAGLVGFGASPAFAAGGCSSLTRDNQNITGSCHGSVEISWTCSSDLFNTLNKKVMNTGAGLSFTFKACNQGVPRGIGIRSL
ncbi:hypothetical protein DEU35_0821 [Microbacterium sp. AG157]|uniref:Uncharacterized protein n=1 Tax=Microbacterium testaceum TaxID=2033 RepID=A0A4Y3QFR0_MICTE|nr:MULTISPECIES: hypothetical protein [Microbacterium]REC99845.1 hypothetical protein DEU35_0821 [Microbacterium sp. AG157]WJS91443.1 hypothetical protein NYQ11_02505 [Microbacterium testaceum]GEB44086.1 hypothetical protein MTE01_00310 [Microbacterium testaceum]